MTKEKKRQLFKMIFTAIMMIAFMYLDSENWLVWLYLYMVAAFD